MKQKKAKKKSVSTCCSPRSTCFNL